MSEDIGHLDWHPEDGRAQYALHIMDTEAESLTPAAEPSWRQRHTRLATLAVTATLLTPISVLGLGGYELGKYFDASTKGSSLELARQHQSCLTFEETIAGLQDSTVAHLDQSSLTVNPSLLPNAERSACGLEGVSTIELDSTYDYNLLQGATVKTVELPSPQSLTEAIRADVQVSKGQEVLSQNEGIGAFLGACAGLLSLVGMSYGYNLRRKRHQKEVTE